MRLVLPGRIEGSLQAPSSKSMTQRALAAAALADGTTEIANASDCEDALAAMECARALGAEIKESGGKLLARGGGAQRSNVLDCNESGLCMRMFAPIAALFGEEFTLTGKGSLLFRPMGMMEEPLAALGARCRTANGKPPVVVQGPMKGGNVAVDGSESSQFVTGLLMALPLCSKDSVLEVGSLKSRPYVSMTLSLLEEFGIKIVCDDALSRFRIAGGQEYGATEYLVEGDWSAAAFLLVAGATAGRVRLRGLRQGSLQADRAIVEALRLSGAVVKTDGDCVSVEKSGLECFDFDASDCPDLFPPLVALACSCRGISRISGAGRLAGKESDRAAALVSEFGKLGGRVRVNGDVMDVEGCGLKGGGIDSHNDHRIAMACAIAALNAKGAVSIGNEACVSKSYPRFFEDLKTLEAGG